MISWGILGGIVTASLNWSKTVQINSNLFSINGAPILSSFLTGFVLVSISYFIYEEMGLRPFRSSFSFRRNHSEPSTNTEEKLIKSSNNKRNK